MCLLEFVCPAGEAHEGRMEVASWSAVRFVRFHCLLGVLGGCCCAGMCGWLAGWLVAVVAPGHRRRPACSQPALPGARSPASGY